MIENNNANNNSIENRACSCCNTENMPTVKTYSYEFSNNNNSCNEETMVASEMLEQIRCLGFAVEDLAEYLDTHVDDMQAVCLHKEYCIKLKDLTDKYQKIYGPLSIYCPCNKWRWIEEPWPWERGNS